MRKVVFARWEVSSMTRKSKAVIALEEQLKEERRRNMLLGKLVMAFAQGTAKYICTVLDDTGEKYKLYSFPNNPRHRTVGLALLTADGHPTCWIADVFDSTYRWPMWVDYEINQYRQWFIRYLSGAEMLERELMWEG